MTDTNPVQEPENNDSAFTLDKEPHQNGELPPYFPYPESGQVQATPQNAPYGYQSDYAQPIPVSGPAMTFRPTEDERTWGLIAHAAPLLLMWITAGWAGILASVMMYLIPSEKEPRKKFYAKQALNIQITGLIGVILSFLLMFVVIGFITLPIVLLWVTILHVMAIARINNYDTLEDWKPFGVLEIVK